MSLGGVLRQLPSVPPVQDMETIADWAVGILNDIVAIESASDHASSAEPTTAGQLELAKHIRRYLGRLGLDTDLDETGCLVVRSPANPEDSRDPVVAFMAQLDAPEDARAVRRLSVTSAWDGSEVLYPEAEAPTVTVDGHEETEPYLREDLLHGPGVVPCGLGSKLGAAQLMTLARVLLTNPEVLHGEVHLVFRPDVKIGRDPSAERLAKHLSGRGARHAYVIDLAEPHAVAPPSGDDAPMLAVWPQKAAQAMEAEALLLPSPVGAPFHPFAQQGIAVARLGMACFAPDTAAEFTSRQKLARHVLWLTHMVQLMVSSR